METLPKPPQEIAAQSLDAHNYFDEITVANPDEMTQAHKAAMTELGDFKPYTRSDEELTQKLGDIESRMKTDGLWDLTKGNGAEERVAYSEARLSKFGYTPEEVTEGALRTLQRGGYVAALRMNRRIEEAKFTYPIDNYFKEHVASAENQNAAPVLDLGALSAEGRAVLDSEFPSGTFLFHSAETEQVLGVLESGGLTTARTLREREKARAEQTGEDEQTVRHNSGFEGISWSMNEIDALPGTRYHLAGFVVAPETALGDGQQLAIPSRPAPNEVIQIPEAIDANEFYDAKTQAELFLSTGLGEKNSVISNILHYTLSKSSDSEFFKDPMLDKVITEAAQDPDFSERMRQQYTVEADGSVRFNPDLVQQVEGDITLGAVWVQAMIDAGTFNNVPEFAGKDLAGFIQSIDESTAKQHLYPVIRAQAKKYEDILDAAENIGNSVEVPIEKMYLVAARKDAAVWERVIATLERKPAGVLLYDDKKVRTENFATTFRGNHKELTEELQKGIVPNDGAITFDQVLGQEFQDSMRAGHAHQVIAESYLDKRRTIHKKNGVLEVV